MEKHEEIMKLLNEELFKDDLTVEEFMLLRSIYFVQTSDKKLFKTLHDKGYLENNEIKNLRRLVEIEEKIKHFFNKEVDVLSGDEQNDFLKSYAILAANFRFYN